MIEKRENAGMKNCNDPTAFIEYLNTIDDVFSNIEDYNPKRKRKILIVFDDMISDIRSRKLNISLVFITQILFSVPKEARLNSTHYLIMKINNRKDLQQIGIDHSADIDYKDFLKTYGNCTNEPYSFFTIDTTLPANDPMRFRKTFSDSPL